MVESLYGGKQTGYYGNDRRESLPLVPPGSNRVLDVGCGAGLTLELLKREGRARETVGIELVPHVAEMAKLKADLVITGNVETVELPFPEEYFDVILLLDVLEHLVDPWETLKRLCTLCRRGGYVIASIPNVCYWRVVLPLVLWDRWDYQEAGVLDRGHLRFWTARSIRNLFRICGLEIEIMLQRRGQRFKLLNMAATMLSAGLIERFFTVQYLVKARRPQRPKRGKDRAW